MASCPRAFVHVNDVVDALVATLANGFGKAQRIFGWEPRIRLRDGLEETYRWIEARL